ncbi:trypsin-like serine protease [Kitasatospora sp. NPDC098663]|uniref:trypsin-like serine protease n=1 Tax=Kitasatospora sp. NPDC098663 TaxID=3364096 RepID=UPI00380858FD
MRNHLHIRGGIAAASTALVLATVAGWTTATAATDGTTPPAPADQPKVAAETFAYPGSAQMLADAGVTMVRGDGGITVTDCANPNQIKVWARSITLHDNWICFAAPSGTGYLAVNIPDAYRVQTFDRDVRASLSTKGQSQTLDVPRNTAKGFGEASPTGDPSALLELRVTGSGAAMPAPQPTDPALAFSAKLNVGDGKRACTAALVDRYWLLTAASCFTDTPDDLSTVTAGAPKDKTTATIGRTDLTNTATGTVTEVVELLPRQDRDLVMARLATPVSGITPATPATTAPVAGESLRIPGYGRTATEWIPTKLHTTTHTAGTISATSVDTAPAPGASALCLGDAGAPAIREKNGKAELVAVTSRSWQGGCLGETETRTGASSSRVDDLAGWVQQTVSTWGTKVDYSSAVVNSVYNPDTKTAEIFALGTNGVLAHASNTEGKGWNSGWEALGDWQFNGIPATIYNPATKAIELFAIGKTGELGHNYWDPGTRKWAGWSVIPSALKLKANPVAVFNPSNQTAEVFTLDTNGYMTHTYSTNGARWDDVRGLGTWQFTGTPTTLYNPATDAVELFATSSRNELGHTYWDNKTKTWADWSTIGGQAVTGSPTAVVNPANNSAEVFITTTTNTMAHSYSLNGARWSDITTMGGWQFNGTPTAVYNPAANSVELFAVRNTGELGHNYWDNKTKTWADWSTISDWKFAGTPSATYNAYTNTLELFATGTNGTMSRATYKNNNWLAWESMPGWTFAITG